MVWPPREAGNVAEPHAQTERASEAEEQEECRSVQYPVVTVIPIVRSHWGPSRSPGRCGGDMEWLAFKRRLSELILRKTL